jgi:thioredoxin 1
VASELIKNVTDTSFEADVLQSAIPVLVDFWAAWCGPCRAIAPVLDDLAQQYQGKVQIVKINVDENRDIPAQYGIRGIPTLMVFNAGSLVETQVGALTKPQLVALIDKHIA